MLWLLASIKDRSVDAYQPVATVRAKGEAIRSFIDAINDTQRGGPVNRHPEDFDLYILGTFDDNTGKIETQQPEKIGDGKTLSQGA